MSKTARQTQLKLNNNRIRDCKDNKKGEEREKKQLPDSFAFADGLFIFSSSDSGFPIALRDCVTKLLKKLKPSYVWTFSADAFEEFSLLLRRSVEWQEKGICWLLLVKSTRRSLSRILFGKKPAERLGDVAFSQQR